MRLFRASGGVDQVGWSPAERRREVYPWSSEIAVGVVLGMVLMLTVGVHLGRGVACLLGGAGWAFPSVADLFTSLPGVLAGDPAAGIDEPPRRLPTRRLLAISVAATELLVVAVAAAAARLTWRRWGAGRLPGAATQVEVARLLGVRRLRRSAAVIRPDLYGEDRR